MKKNLSKLKKIAKIVTSKIGKSRMLRTFSRHYYIDPNKLHEGYKKIGMNDDMIKIVDKLLERSKEVYVVGGAVRDLIMGKTPHDFDIATNIKPEDVIGLFGEKSAKLTGNVFPTVRVKEGNSEMEISTFRKEISMGMEGDRNKAIVQYADDIESDLARRDLDINAIALNLNTGKVVDPFNGTKSIKNKIIKFVGNPYDRLKEDPLRYLRAIRFRLRIGGTYDPATKAAMSNPDVKNMFLNKVSKERIHEEMIKGVASVDKFSGFFTDLKEFDILKDVFPDLDRMNGLDMGKWHSEDVFTHSMMVGDNYKIKNPNNMKQVVGKLTGYFHDISKPDQHDKLGSFFDHEVAGAEKIKQVFKEYKFSNDEVNQMSSLVLNHTHKPTTMKEVRKLYSTFGEDWKGHVKMQQSDSVSNKKKMPEDIAKTDERMNNIAKMFQSASKDKKSFMELAISGNDLIKDLKLKPGPMFKEILDFAKDSVFENPERNTSEYLMRLIKEKFHDRLPKRI